jgi:hypothetical protein
VPDLDLDRNQRSICRKLGVPSERDHE